MKPCTRRVPKISKKTIETCDVQNFAQSSESSCWGTYEGIQKQMANNSWTIPSWIGSMVTHFQLPPYEYHWAARQARDIAISANSLGTWSFSKEQLCGQFRRSLRNYPIQNRVERRRLPNAYLWYKQCTLATQKSSCWCTYEGIQKQMANNSLKISIRIGSMVTHFQLPPYEFYWATRQARDIVISVNSLCTWFFSKE